jgi:hypothetical protein
MARRVARAPRLAAAIGDTWDTLALTLDEFQRGVLEDVLFQFHTAQDYGVELPLDDSDQWLLALAWLRTRPLQRPAVEP